MPVYKSRAVFEIRRGLRAFLNLEAGLARGGEVPDYEALFGQAQRRIRGAEPPDGAVARAATAQATGGGWQAERRQERDVARRGAPRRRFRAVRRDIASRYLTGSGIEVGALHQPLEVPAGASVRYLDRMTVEQLRDQYPELSGHEMTPVDIVDDGETLPSVDDDSVDFVIANHMMEHCQDPIRTFENHLRVLKPDGVLYVSVPDKRQTFDRDRPITPLEHLIRDYEEGPKVSKDFHFEEWARLMDKLPEDKVPARAQQLIETDFSIHFHVWTQMEFLELLLYCRNNLPYPFEIELFQKNDIEVISVLRKHSGS